VADGRFVQHALDEPGRQAAVRRPDLQPTPLSASADSLLRIQRDAGNHAVVQMLALQFQGSSFGMGAAVPKCTLSTPGNCAAYGDWVDQLPDYKGTGGADVNLTNDPRVPADLRSLVADMMGSGLPDCADIAFVLRHYWLKAQGKSFSFKSGRSVKDSVEFTLGKDASDKEVRACMIGNGTGQFQEERKQFALVDYYKGKGGKITDFEELRKAGLKKGDMFVWIRKAGITGNFQGHVQTIQSLDEKSKTMTVVQGNMVAGKGVGELQQRQYTFADLTGNAAGKGEVQPRTEEDFYGAGPWKG
jgi:hypothetical protein